MTAKLVLRSSSADFLLTILIAASCPVYACLAFLTLPDAPLPTVFPSRQGPTCVLRLDFPEALVDADICESRFVLRCSSSAIADIRLSSALDIREPVLLRIWRLPPFLKDSWRGMCGEGEGQNSGPDAIGE